MKNNKNEFEKQEIENKEKIISKIYHRGKVSLTE